MDKLIVNFLKLALLVIAGSAAERYCDANEGNCNRYVLKDPQCS